MDEPRIFKLTWHYTAVIFPLILLVATIGSVESIDHYTNKTLYFGPKEIGTLLFTIYLWLKCLSVSFEVRVKENGEITARSMLRKKRLPISEVYKVRHGFLCSKIYFKNGSFQITNLMNNYSQLISIILSHNSNLIVEYVTRK